MSGILTRKATAKARNTHVWVVCERGRPRSELSTKVSGAPCWLAASAPVAMAATSMKNEPMSV